MKNFIVWSFIFSFAALPFSATGAQAQGRPYAAQGSGVQSVKNIKLITLRQAQNDALQNSAELKQALATAAAAQAQYKNAQSGLYPSLTFDAKGTYVSQVPSLQVGLKSMEFGDKWGGSAGPSLSYTLFDYGRTEKQAQSAYAAWQGAINSADFTRKNIILQTRQAYFNVQQDLQHIYFAHQQLKVAQTQLNDIQAAYKAGAKSNLDVNMAQKQKLKTLVNISAARGALGGHLRQLFRLTGKDYNIDASYPQDSRADYSADATAYIKTDDLQDAIKLLQANSSNKFDEASPALAALTNTAQYYEYLALSFKSALYPRVTLTGGVYWEYPNGPLHEDVVNGRAGIGISVPIFEGGKSKQAAAAQNKQKEAALWQKQDSEQEMQKLFYTSQSLLTALDEQEKLTYQIIDTCTKTAQLTYAAYSAGTVTFLEVDSANLNLLEAQTALADLYAKRLNSLAILENLGRGK